MRFFHSLLLAIGCFALVLQSNAADIPAKQTHTSTEYRNAELSIPQEGLNDYHHSSTFSIRNATAGKSFQEEPDYITVPADQRINRPVLNDPFHNIRILLSEVHAKKFRSRLLFPKHYHW